MRILFLTIGRMENIQNHSIYTDLLRCFRDNGHDVYTVSTSERYLGFSTTYCQEGGIHALRVLIGNITQCGFIEKGFSTIFIEFNFLNAIKKYLKNVKFDLVLYSTPPVTLVGVVNYIKNRDKAKSYLLLKDIFPQNAVDLGMIKKTGIKSPIYKFFRKKEKQLYKISDWIGCMSQANVDYILNHNMEIDSHKVEICPNSIQPRDMRVKEQARNEIRNRYNIPIDKRVFVYGGNLGKPQGILFLINCLESQLLNRNIFFLIIGSGTEFIKLKKFFNNKKPKNMKLLERISKDEYDKMIAACDVGMIFLDYRFTIPNFPSRLLSYMQAGLPVLACTDNNTDVGRIITNGRFGWWCNSKEIKEFSNTIYGIEQCPNIKDFGKRAREYLIKHYDVKKAYEIIVRHNYN